MRIITATDFINKPLISDLLRPRLLIGENPCRHISTAVRSEWISLSTKSSKDISGDCRIAFNQTRQTAFNVR
ncbi:MAG: hypothetical protein DMF61_15625 [Blastocatellia bacterium AA13]|nr:MAG: hypothetical protein DMF61_15625 [Blastocatellia bacterium AA13]